MAIQFRLPEDVRNKYDLPEWVTYDPDTLMVNEAIQLQDALGIDPMELLDGITRREGKRVDMRAWKYVIWLAVHRSGADVSYSDFDVNLFALNVASDSADEEEVPLVSVLDGRPKLGLAGVRRVRADGVEAKPMRHYPAAWTSGFVIVRRTALEASGWFDERFFAFGEKADLCLRLQRHGWEVGYTTRLTVRSPGERQRDPHLEAHAAHARMQFARKHFPLAAADYRWALVLRYAVRFGLSTLLPRFYDSDERQAARAALATVLRGRPSLEESEA